MASKVRKTKPTFEALRRAQRAAQIAAARSVFAQLPPIEQRRLTVELVDARRDELRLAYPDVKSVAAGYRLKRTTPRGRPRIEDEPCVVFMVRKKLSTKTEIATLVRRARLLPRDLLCHVTLDGHRRLCAVPTDVDEIRARGRLRLHGGSETVEIVPANGLEPDTGVMTCALARQKDPGEAYLVSCRHVLGYPSWDGSGAASVAVRHKGTVIARASRSVFGTLAPGIVSFDAQLANIVDPAGCRAALAGRTLGDPILKSEEHEIPKPLFILTPRGAVAIDLNQLVDGEAAALPYVTPAGTRITIRHELLLESLFAGTEHTQAGDSGSPVTTSPDGGRLVGMHIASTELVDPSRPPRCFAIPAWQLFTPECYTPSAAGERWSFLRPEDIPVPTAQRVTGITSAFVDAFTKAFGLKLSAPQQEGIAALLGSWAAVQGDAADKDQLAYVLASCWHETGGRMQPVRETFATTDAAAIRALEEMFQDGRIGSPYHRTDPQTGRAYFGRGLIQLTHRTNYVKLGADLGLPLETQPELALQMDVSAQIAVVGMSKGRFTGKKLADFFGGGAQRWEAARAIVNGGGDQAAKIADFGRKFRLCL